MYLGPYQRPAQLHSATAQQSPQGSSMKGLCAVVGIGITAVLHSVLNNPNQTRKFVVDWIMMKTSIKLLIIHYLSPTKLRSLGCIEVNGPY